MPTAAQLFPSRFLRAEDLKSPRIVKIARVAIEQLGDDRKLVLYFEREAKGLAINRTNFTALCDLTSETDSDLFVGHTLELFAQSVPFRGQIVPAIRLRRPRKARAAVPPPVAADAPDDEADAEPF
jgi:hypothetical protein